ncbi:hypothetical protein HG537_0F02040 [Torulaspora globosa]|uniref:Autophagy protein 5 n=1 Tax=Torulaspora globosa TaxID=48254 RepID=A0A7H9HVY5_9SACH|nr:hypothetical protein HG537_0F02040 [Torulaspora sp. CBS 2947]
MDEIRRLVWEGTLNVQITVKPSLLIGSVDIRHYVLNLRLPRESYIGIYLRTIIDRLRNHLRVDPDSQDQFVWLECQGVPVYWNYPVGMLYDSMTGLNPSNRSCSDEVLNVWRLELAQGSQLPAGVIPFGSDLQLVRTYWMQQWKQACYVLNGSAKQMMSLSMQDTQKFWDALIVRDQDAFKQVASKIIPIKPRSIPICIHQSLPKMQMFQPIVTGYNSDGSRMKLEDLMKEQFSSLFMEDTSLAKIVSNGIEIPLTLDLLDVYGRFMSFDGYLHLSLCLLSESEYGRSIAK